MTQTKEVYREVGSFVWLEDLERDLRHAVRTLRKSPAFTTAAAATLPLAPLASFRLKPEATRLWLV